MKRGRDVDDFTPNTGLKAGLQTQSSQSATASTQEARRVDTGEKMDNEYEAELQAEAYMEGVFKIGIPNYRQVVHDIYQYALEAGLPPKLPDDVLRRFLRPHFQAFVKKPWYKTEQTMQLLYDIWNMRDGWTYPVDNVYAQRFAGEIECFMPDSPNSILCENCRIIDIDEELANLCARRFEDLCPLCKLLSQRFATINNLPKTSLVDCRSLLRVCAVTAADHAHPDLQLGFPTLPTPETRLKILREWLQLCDRNHQEVGCSLEIVPFLPARVLDVSDGGLRLHISQPGDRGDYIALSHCWGNMPNTPLDDMPISHPLEMVGQDARNI